MASPEEQVLAALRKRNAASAAACTLARSHEALLAEVSVLDATARTCERLEQEATVAKAAEAQAADAAQLMGDKLAEAQAKAAELEHSLQQTTAREEALRKENETLLTRLTEHLQMRAEAMDTEREEFEARAERNSNAAEEAPAPAPADEPSS